MNGEQPERSFDAAADAWASLRLTIRFLHDAVRCGVRLDPAAWARRDPRAEPEPPR